MRLFVALDFEKFKGYFEELQITLSKIIGLKIKMVSSYHLTMKFLGDVEDSKVDEIIKKLKNIEFTEFEVGLNDLGLFPDRKNPRVVWVGVKPEDGVVELQKQISTGLVDFQDDYNFKPHITLGRIKAIEDKKLFLDRLNEIKIDNKTLKINSFCLYKSDLTREGPVYEVIEKFDSS
tara:strand:+ start:18349 stop:18879 length:531 start_codon:yes stop_codon:yes gene_type:complete